jgi:hypothetical protein
MRKAYTKIDLRELGVIGQQLKAVENHAVRQGLPVVSVSVNFRLYTVEQDMRCVVVCRCRCGLTTQ